MRGIAAYMTAQPWSVQIDDSVTVARGMLAERGIRHLPVLDGKQLVGMVTERDLAAVANRVAATVEDVMTRAPQVTADTPLPDVLESMLMEPSDAVVVIGSDGKVAGIFTAMDAVRVLRELLVRTRRSRRTA